MNIPNRYSMNTPEAGSWKPEDERRKTKEVIALCTLSLESVAQRNDFQCMHSMSIWYFHLI